MKFSRSVPISLVLALFATLALTGQNENNLVQDSIIPLDSDAGFVWDMSFAFKTMNVFRGLLPSKAPVLSTEAGFKAGNIVVGAYGGASFNGGYTETDLILVCESDGAQISGKRYLTNQPVMLSREVF